jgi:PKD repeat protein
MSKIRATFLLLFLVIGGVAIAQPEKGGIPRSFRLKSFKANTAILRVTPPDADSLATLDNKAALNEKPYRVGVTLPLNLGTANSGTWTSLADGSKLWIMSIQCPGAKALGLYYKKFQLPEGADLYVYSSDKSHIIGAFTSDNNVKGDFATRPVSGDEITIEYYQPASVEHSPGLIISGLMYAYRSANLFTWNPSDAFNTSGSCEVNVACTEGANWQNEKRGVALILSLVNGSNYLCTGSLMNNTSLNFDPLILSANHCAEDEAGTSTYFSKPSDFDKYIFYFNYESSTCTDPFTMPTYQSYVGATKLASTLQAFGGDFGSDFLLVKLKNTIPEVYRPYYNGWSIDDVASSSGVCIHHPEGDIKKISTYDNAIESTAYETTPNTHWKVIWAATQNGHGVTEPGSSGSPLFNSDRLVIGALTGGDSYCSKPTAGDYFGKVSYSFQSNGSTDSLQLKPWLDPAGVGFNSLSGTYKTLSPIAEFKADTTVIPVNGTVNFKDLSLGMPDSWHWYFPGAETTESTLANPQNVKYNSYGTYDIKLVVSNAHGSDTITKKNFVSVNARLYPNPTTGVISILKGYDGPTNFEIEIHDPLGREVFDQVYQYNYVPSISLDLSVYRGNFFFITFRYSNTVETYKVIVARQSNHN